MDNLMTRAEYDLWYTTLPENHCSFCDWQNSQIVLKEFNNWVWIACLAPYWKYHTMIIPKRHLETYSDQTFLEAGELVSVIDFCEKKMIDAKLKRDDDTLIEKFIYFWRHRINRFDPVSNNIRMSHFHVHLCPDKDHVFDPILDSGANTWNVNLLKQYDQLVTQASPLY